MRVLLDENLPHRLREHITGHIVETVSFIGWSGLKNGDLLKVAEAGGIEVFITGDRNLLLSAVYERKKDCFGDPVRAELREDQGQVARDTSGGRRFYAGFAPNR